MGTPWPCSMQLAYDAVGQPTQVVQSVAGRVEGAGEELESDDGEDGDGEHEEQRDVGQRADGLDDGTDDHLQA